MKDETAGVAIKEFVELKPKMYSFLVDDNSEHKRVSIKILLKEQEVGDDLSVCLLNLLL